MVDIVVHAGLVLTPDIALYVNPSKYDIQLRPNFNSYPNVNVYPQWTGIPPVLNSSTALQMTVGFGIDTNQAYILYKVKLISLGTGDESDLGFPLTPTIIFPSSSTTTYRRYLAGVHYLRHPRNQYPLGTTK